MDTPTDPGVPAAPEAGATAQRPMVVEPLPDDRTQMERHGLIHTFVSEEATRLSEHIQVLTEDQAQFEIEAQRKKRAFDAELKASRSKLLELQQRVAAARKSFETAKARSLAEAGVSPEEFEQFMVEVGPNFSVVRLFRREEVPSKES